MPHGSDAYGSGLPQPIVSQMRNLAMPLLSSITRWMNGITQP